MEEEIERHTGHIPFFRFFFGKHRDLFVAFTISVVCGLFMPTAVDEAFYSSNDTILLISLCFLLGACLLHFIHFFLSATRGCTSCEVEGFSYSNEVTKYDPIAFVVAGMLFIGDFVFLISNIDDDCSSYGNGSDLVLQCEKWWDNFTVTVVMYFMIAYLIPLIFANRVARDIQAKFWFSSNQFRIAYLCSVLAVSAAYLGFCLWVYWDDYGISYRVWLYCAISLEVASAIIAVMVSQIIRVNLDPSSPPRKQYGWIIIWFLLASTTAVFGCYIYWKDDMKTSNEGAWYRCGEMVMYSQWSVWVIAEAFVPINVPMMETSGQYQELQV